MRFPGFVYCTSVRHAGLPFPLFLYPCIAYGSAQGSPEATQFCFPFQLFSFCPNIHPAGSSSLYFVPDLSQPFQSHL